MGKSIVPVRSGGGLVRRTEAERAKLRGGRERFAVSGTPEGTRRSYQHDIDVFVTWAEEWGFPVDPTHPDVVVDYVTYLAEERKLHPSSIDRAVAAICYLQRQRPGAPGLRTPQLREHLRRVRITLGAEQREAAALLVEHAQAIVVAIGSNPDARGVRDRALILLGLATACRRSELAALNLRDLVRTKDGIEVHIRKSKTDQEGRGRVVPVSPAKDGGLCPVWAVEQWLAVRGDGEPTAPVFQSLRRYTHQRSKKVTQPTDRISGDQVNLAVQRWQVRAGIKPDNPAEHFSAHSLRAGFITIASLAGRSGEEIMEHSNHRTHRVFMRYIRKARKFETNPQKGLW